MKTEKPLSASFIESKMFRLLGPRAFGFLEIVKFLEEQLHSRNYFQIIETGTARLRDNWGGDGQSTLIWDWIIERHPQVKALSIDLNPQYIEVARSQTKHVDFACEDSLQCLSRLDRRTLADTRLLYLDSFDYDEGKQFESAMHHLQELTCCWSSLPPGCMIVVDDRHSDRNGKHVFVQHFMEKMKVPPVFAEFQIGWIKP